MLRALSIRDYVIVERLDLELAGGFTALTGETGAGKSILVDALALALGGRADAGVVRAGASRAFVNGRPATVAQLRELGEMLVDIHGQHDHQLLLKRDRQRALVDAFGGHEPLAAEVARLHGTWRRAADQRIARERAQATSARERELVAHEIR